MSSDSAQREPVILVVDDSSIDRRMAATIVEKEGQWKALTASNGVEALSTLRQHAGADSAPVLVLTDVVMPEMDGLELVTELRQQFPVVPVVLMTAHGSEELALQALRQGATSYVPKRLLAQELVPTLEAVLAVAARDYGRRRLMSCLTRTEYDFELASDPALIPPLVLLLQDGVQAMHLCDEASRTRVGIALEEALVNAMYHGNLEVSSELRNEGDRPYMAMIESRRRQSPYKDRVARVQVKLLRTEATFIITDEGPGFDPTALPDPTDPANLESVAGRGLLLIRTFMNSVVHNAKGNQITMRLQSAKA